MRMRRYRGQRSIAKFESWRKLFCSDRDCVSYVYRLPLLLLPLSRSRMSVEEEAVPLSGENRLAHKAMARSVATPTNKLPLSSVFVTPPASMERKRSSDLPPPAPGIQPPLFPTPEATPTSTRAVSAKLRLEEGENAVSGLFVGGYRLLTGQILDYLDPQDLYK